MTRALSGVEGRPPRRAGGGDFCPGHPGERGGRWAPEFDFLGREIVLPTEKIDFLIGEIDFPGREFEFLTREIVLLTEKVDFLIGEFDFAIREPNAYLSELFAGTTRRRS